MWTVYALTIYAYKLTLILSSIKRCILYGINCWISNQFRWKTTHKNSFQWNMNIFNSWLFNQWGLSVESWPRERFEFAIIRNCNICALLKSQEFLCEFGFEIYTSIALKAVNIANSTAGNLTALRKISIYVTVYGTLRQKCLFSRLIINLYIINVRIYLFFSYRHLLL